jgi:hypothetical protein
MASKVWDDLSMWNVDFSQVYPSFDLSRVNSLELAMLEALKYVIRVSASEYAKYYFLLRSMMVKLGLHNEDPNYIRPLDLAGARKLQLSTEKYEQFTTQPITPRRHSVHDTTPRLVPLERNHSVNYEVRHHYSQVGIEQLIHQKHVDADGVEHQTAKKRGSTDYGKPPKQDGGVRNTPRQDAPRTPRQDAK